MKAARLVTLALTLIAVSGCRTWQMVPTTPDVTRPLRSQSRLIHTNGQQIEISEGRVTPDSVIGVSRSVRVAVPRDSVARVEERRFSPARSLGLVALYFGMAFAISGPAVFGQ